MKILIPPIVGFLIVIAMMALTGCKQLEDRGLGVSLGFKLEDGKLWGGIGFQKHPALAERETLEGEPPYQIEVQPSAN